jgi:hypothetical protein
MNTEVKKTTSKKPSRKSSKLKGLIASWVLPILGTTSVLSPNKAEGATSGYGATADYRVSNVVQFFQGSTERESGIDQAVLSYKISDAQNNQRVNTARTQLSKRISQLETTYAKAKNNAMNKYQYAQQQGNVNGMVQAYRSLVSAGRSYINGYTSAYDNWGRALINAQKSVGGAALRADINTVNSIHYGNRMQSNSLDRIHAGAGVKQSVKGGSVGAGVSGSVGDVLSITRSAGEYGKAGQVGENAGYNAQLILVTGTNVYNDIGVAVSEKIATVQNDLAPMEDYIRASLVGTNNYNLQTSFDNAVIDASFDEQQINLAEKIQRGVDNATTAALQLEKRGKQAENNANRKASKNLQRATDGIGLGGKLKKIFGR